MILYLINPVILSGDGKSPVESVCAKLGVNSYGYSLLPSQKADRIAEIKACGKTAFIGDGINDAPSIALSDIGIAMGGLGSGVAVESADAVVLDDDISKVPLFIRAAKKIRKIVIENIAFSIAVKVAVMVLGVCIKLPLIDATLADVGLMIIAILNAFRCERIK